MNRIWGAGISGATVNYHFVFQLKSQCRAPRSTSRLGTAKSDRRRPRSRHSDLFDARQAVDRRQSEEGGGGRGGVGLFHLLGLVGSAAFGAATDLVEEAGAVVDAREPRRCRCEAGEGDEDGRGRSVR